MWFLPASSSRLVSSEKASGGVPGHVHSTAGWAMTQPPCLGSGRPSSSAQHILSEDPSRQTAAPHRITWSDCTTVLAPQMSKATCWEDYLPWVLQDCVVSHFLLAWSKCVDILFWRQAVDGFEELRTKLEIP
ncbi:uncharacterized protein ACBT57_015597 [Dama dama]